MDRTTLFNVSSPKQSHLSEWEIWRHYATSEFRDCLFVKTDDDVVFLEAGRFGSFLNAIDTHRGSVISANVVNNEACTKLEPELWVQLSTLNLSLTGASYSADFASVAHQHFFDHHRELLGLPVELVSTEDYLGIHLVGYDWSIGQAISGLIGTTAPPALADRVNPLDGLGGEESVQMLPRLVMRGFAASHLTFGAQEHDGKMKFGDHGWAERLDSWREGYGKIGQRYLEAM
jgi:hypothetical protein